MTRKLIAMLAMFVIQMLVVPQSLSAAEGLGNDYRLGYGDTLSIIVYDESDLTLDATLDDKGTITYPFLGELELGGKSTAQVEQLITNGLKGRYLIQPKVSVSIKSYRPYFIDGEIKKPGGYPFQPGLTVQKAVSLAGGFTNRASHSKLYVIHENEKSDDRRKVDLNTQLLPGDLLIIEESFF